MKKIRNAFIAALLFATAPFLALSQVVNPSPPSPVKTDNHADWFYIQTPINLNPTEFNIYNAAAQGIGQTVNGTNQINRTSGTAFSSSWIGYRFYFNQSIYLVVSVPSANQLTVKNLDNSAVTFSSNTSGTYQFVLTTNNGTVNVSGTAVTRVSGQAFNPLATAITINGTNYSATYVDQNHVTLGSSGGTQTNVAYSEAMNINDQVSTVRIQKVLGANEENFALYASANGYYYLSSLYAGAGQYWPIRTCTGEAVPGTLSCLVEVDPGSPAIGSYGSVSLGGVYGSESARALAIANAVNRVEIGGAATATAPALRARGADTNVSFGFDAQGTGQFTFTNNSFANTLAQITATGINSTAIGASAPSTGAFTTLTATGQTSLGGAAGAESLRAITVASAVNRLEAGGSATGVAPAFRARGTDTNVSMGFDIQGTGGQFTFTNNSFGSIIAQITPTGLNNTVIGASTPLAGTFTTMNANTSATVGANSATTPTIFINGAAANNRLIRFQTAGSNRWAFNANNNAESGGNAGTDLQINSSDDTGTFLATEISITRSSGNIVLGRAGASVTTNTPTQGDNSTKIATTAFVAKTLPLVGTTASIGGGALVAGACTSGTVAVANSTTGMSVIATPVTYPGDGIFWNGYVSVAGTVTVKVCASVAATPTASVYNVRVIQ